MMYCTGALPIGQPRAGEVQAEDGDVEGQQHGEGADGLPSNTTLCYTVLRCIISYYITLHYVTLCCIMSHSITLYYTVILTLFDFPDGLPSARGAREAPRRDAHLHQCYHCCKLLLLHVLLHALPHR